MELYDDKFKNDLNEYRSMRQLKYMSKKFKHDYLHNKSANTIIKFIKNKILFVPVNIDDLKNIPGKYRYRILLLNKKHNQNDLDENISIALSCSDNLNIDNLSEDEVKCVIESIMSNIKQNVKIVDDYVPVPYVIDLREYKNKNPHIINYAGREYTLTESQRQFMLNSLNKVKCI